MGCTTWPCWWPSASMTTGFGRSWASVRAARKTKKARLSLLRHRKERGLTDPELVISDACLGLREAPGEVSTSLVGSGASYTSTAT